MPRIVFLFFVIIVFKEVEKKLKRCASSIVICVKQQFIRILISQAQNINLNNYMFQNMYNMTMEIVKNIFSKNWHKLESQLNDKEDKTQL